MYLSRPKSPSQNKSAFLLALAAGLACYIPAASMEEADTAKTAAGNARMLENILAKEGISIGGAFRSRYLHSSLEGPGTMPNLRSEESVEYTSVDFDIRARPNTATQGRLIMRMHQDWRNFFSDIGNPIHTRWLSIDGKVKEMFSYNAGDFRQKYSPLTLYAPDFVVLHEPGLFAGQRQEAMDEAFLGNNDRLLQGVNLNFDAALDKSGIPLLEEIHVNALGARLRNVETSIQNGAKPTNLVEKSPIEKFLAASNADLVLPFGASLGGSYLYIFDKKGSFSGSEYVADSVAQKTNIFAGRLGFDLDKVVNAGNWKAGLSAELAKSADDSTRHSLVTNPDLSIDTNLVSQSIDGTALLARLHGEFKSGTLFGVRVGVNYIRNEADYRNELAQTPSFVGERIMNIENDSTIVGRTNDARARNYSTYDAMYGHVFKFAPSATTNLWQKAPFTKNSYTHQIMTQGELGAFASQRADTALQLVMPFGPATPNRIGLSSDATVSFWMDRIEIQGVFASLENVEGVRIDTARTWSKTKFSQAGGGLKLEIGSMIGLSLPLTLSGSFIRSGAENDGANDSAAAYAPIKVTSDFINLGAQYAFWKRFAVLAGYQQISTTITRSRLERETIQTHMAGGLDYKVAAGAHLLFSVGKIDVDNPPGTNPLALNTDFSQLQTDLFMSVHF